ncbi:MAG: polyprenyl synthetase family protein, partial [Lachnospiraceae bacterium]|nr:polyprenyl synthetase family protein [Lachnospiraceae bacterium]
LNHSFQIAIEALQDFNNIEKKIQALCVFSKKPGIYGMIGGQAVDVENCDRPMEKDKLDFIYNLKTGALIEGSMMIGAIMAGASPEEVKQIEEIGWKIGLAYQIQDDILDVIGEEEVIGKPLNSDDKNHKTTYVTLLGLEEAQKRVKKLSMEAVNQLEAYPQRNKFLEEMIKYLIFREK